ncbi:MAG TPA: helix-turn-helix domain-containing protein [Streptosporangiaceae bacterium]|nr:helix-turn-helix domain-containing protein [Streptosporangiaceae bacterium]
MGTDDPAVAELMASVAATVSRRADAVSEDVYEVILREIPELHGDQPVLTLLASSVHSNIATCLQIMQHQIDLSAVQAPAAAVEYARRRAQRGTSLTALLRAYRLGHTCFSDWLLKELARQADDAQMITAATLAMSKIVAGYVDQTSEEIVAAYTRERERWLRNRSAARAGRIRDLLSGARVNVSAAEATLGYRLRQYHVGVVCWAGDATSAVDNITRLEHAIGHVAGKAACSGDPVFLPRDESSAWAWLPLGIRDTFDAKAASTAGLDDDIHFAFGDAVRGTTGFRLTHQQAIAAQAVALAAGPPAAQAVAFSEVAPVAMMLGSAELLRAWVFKTLAGLADDDEHHARLRDTLLAFLQTGGSYKTTAERLMLHKNTVQYRIRKAEESLGRPVAENQHDVELALRASYWLGSSVLQPTRERRPAVLGLSAAGSPGSWPAPRSAVRRGDRPRTLQIKPIHRAFSQCFTGGGCHWFSRYPPNGPFTPSGSGLRRVRAASAAQLDRATASMPACMA